MRYLILAILLFSCIEEVVWEYDPHQHHMLRQVVGQVVDSLSERGLEVDVSKIGMKVEVLKNLPSPTRDAHGMYINNVLYIDEYRFYQLYFDAPYTLRMLVLHELGHYLGLDHVSGKDSEGNKIYDRWEWMGWDIMVPGIYVNVATPEWESGCYDIFVDKVR